MSLTKVISSLIGFRLRVNQAEVIQLREPSRFALTVGVSSFGFQLGIALARAVTVAMLLLCVVQDYKPNLEVSWYMRCDQRAYRTTLGSFKRWNILRWYAGCDLICLGASWWHSSSELLSFEQQRITGMKFRSEQVISKDSDPVDLRFYKKGELIPKGYKISDLTELLVKGFKKGKVQISI
ncbi:hypothetical protein F511_25883 [Dorcoceras hygrometricum]|uniref:Uncharacterized protein n=1 Tax=Dorcoceras hygrometricum TaxID=472368 RepID=A0A2Z7A5G4_9LAMI|nr:hypothetical protein F511_25883 [Dorcoceras hygrometricum]